MLSQLRMHSVGKLQGLLNILGATDLAGERVVDVGTGIGVGAWALALRGAAEVVSITVDARDEAVARQRLPSSILRRVSFVCQDVSVGVDLPEAGFAFALCDHFVSAIDAYTPGTRIDALREIARLVRFGGELCVVDEAPIEAPPPSTWQGMLRSLWDRIVADQPGPGVVGYENVPLAELVEDLRAVGWSDIRSTPTPAWDERGAAYLEANLDGIERMNSDTGRLDAESLRRLSAEVRSALSDQGPAPGAPRYTVWGRRVV